MGFAIHHPSVTWHVQSLCVLIILIKQSANTSDGRILLHMSIMVWKIDKSTISRLTFSETDFDSITKRLPSGLYTTFRTFAQHTKVIGLSAHLARLYQPAKTQGLVIVRTQRKLRQILAQLLNSMGTDEARLRIVLDTTSEPGTLYVMMQVFQVLPEKLYHEGACVALSARSREEPKLKKTQFISASATERECIGENVFEILLTHRGRILEGMTSNFFYVCGETLGTAARGVLLGVTRGTVLALARQAEIRIRYRALPCDEISTITEAFITSSSRGIVPIAQIEHHDIGSAGTIMQKLMEMYDRQLYSLAEPFV